MSIRCKKFNQFFFFFFLALNLISGLGSFVKNGRVLLSGGGGVVQNVGSLRIINSKVDVLANWQQGLRCVPRGFYCQDYFCCFFLWALKWWIRPPRLCAHCCKKKKKEKKEKIGSRIMQRCISWWQLYVVVWCCRALCVISTLSSFESNHSVCLEKGGFRNHQFLQNWNPT